MMGVPTFYTRLLDDERFTKDLVSHMRLFVSGSAPLLAETHVLFEQRTGHRILERYGMTETNMNTSNPYDGERRAGTVGFPLPGVSLRVVRPGHRQAMPHGEIGIIEVKGPNVFSGYWQMPEKTKEEFREDGFFITGDVGVIDADGYVQIVGRSKDLIISGGYNIYPKELELLLDEEEGVLESAVIGVPHADFGEGVVAVLVPRPGARLEEEVILESIKPKIARFKQPKRIVVLDELAQHHGQGSEKRAARRLQGVARWLNRKCFRQFASVRAGEPVAIVAVVADGGTPCNRRLLAFTAWSGLDFFVRALLLKAALYADCLLRWRCLLQPGWLL
jgi:malonyl-CoA/methylmalonyl-CoA synthetase